MRGRTIVMMSLVGSMASMLGCHAQPAPVTPAEQPQRQPQDAALPPAPARLAFEVAAAEHACEGQHDAAACGVAARRYRDGADGDVFDPARAFGLATLGCDGGDPAACAALASLHLLGLGTTWSPQRAIALYERSCAADHATACGALAKIYDEGRGVDGDPERAGRYLERARALWLTACKDGDGHACAEAASQGHNRDPSTRSLAQRGCEHGDRHGCVLVLHAQLAEPAAAGAALQELDRRCNDDEAEACEELAAAGDLPGRAYDARRSAADTLRACVLGSPRACVRAGILHELAAGVPRDDAVARDYFARACERGASRGCLHLAQARFVTGDSDAATTRLVERGCELGSAEACDLRSRLELSSHDRAAVVRWAIEACRLGLDVACARLTRQGVTPPAHAPHDVDPRFIAPRELAVHRIEGRALIVPDVETKRLIDAVVGNTPLTGTFKLCLSAHGTVTSVAALRSTGSLAYDRLIERTIYGWRYQPLVIDGVAVPLCTAATFHYTQKR